MSKKNKTSKDLLSMKKVEPLIKVRYVQLLAPPDTTSSKNIVRFVVTRKKLEELQRQYPEVKVISPINIFQSNRGIMEKDILYLVEMSKDLYDSATDIRNRFRKEARNNGGGGGDNPPQSSIFHRLIDEDMMADCILEITEKIFHGEKECQICQKTFNKYEFYLLMHYYFDYIHILKNKNRLPFCQYLNNKVFAGKETGFVRSFNNYAQKDVFVRFKKFLEVNKNIRFDNVQETRPASAEEILLAPFQKIGWHFHFSNYFDTLRIQQKEVESFIL